MDGGARDITEDWLLPEQARPPTIGEIERRVNEALATARASEAAVMTVGAAALDAAEQARRAAELAERASIAAVEVQERAPSSIAGLPAATPEHEDEDESLSDFSQRADRLVARLRQLQRLPLEAPAATDAATRPQPAR